MSRLEMPLGGEAGEPSVDEAAERAAAASALLPGENPTSNFLDDAEHWCTVYTELLSFKNALLNQVRDRLDAGSPEVRGEVDVDRVLLSNQANRYRMRLTFWEERRRQLSGEVPA